VCTSREKLFGMITFIDTPGLVDGSFQYPFPVEDAIVAVAKHVDLIYVFFDPIGQALCGECHADHHHLLHHLHHHLHHLLRHHLQTAR